MTKKPPATAPQQDGFFITEDLNQAADEAKNKKRKGSEVAMVPQSAGSGQGKLQDSEYAASLDPTTSAAA